MRDNDCCRHEEEIEELKTTVAVLKGTVAYRDDVIALKTEMKGVRDWNKIEAAGVVSLTIALFVAVISHVI